LNRREYLAELRRRLTFLSEDDKDEVIADIDELYEGLESSGMDEAAILKRIGSPRAVASEYRLSERLDDFDRDPGAAAGLRMAIAAIGATIARGFTLQLLGLLWFALALVLTGVAVATAASILLAIASIAGFDPVVTTLAVPGVPPVAGLFLGMGTAVAFFAVFLGIRQLMRMLGGLMRSSLNRTRRAKRTGETVGPGGATARSGWINSNRAIWQVAITALALALVSGALTLTVPAPEYPVSVDLIETIQLDEGSRVEIYARHLHLRLGTGDAVSASMTGSLQKTAFQDVELSVERPEPGTVRIDATYEEGLSWGINQPPELLMTLPAGSVSEIVLSLVQTTVELDGFPDELLAVVRYAE
jgi:uncharacterized membrane protein